MENEKIQAACKFIMLSIFSAASEASSKSKSDSVISVTNQVINETCENSQLSIIINDNNWDILFSDKRWLNYLFAAQNLSITNPKLVRPLKTLASYFPLETKCFIFSEALKI